MKELDIARFESDANGGFKAMEPTDGRMKISNAMVWIGFIEAMVKDRKGPAMQDGAH